MPLQTIQNWLDLQAQGNRTPTTNPTCFFWNEYFATIGCKPTDAIPKDFQGRNLRSNKPMEKAFRQLSIKQREDMFIKAQATLTADMYRCFCNDTKLMAVHLSLKEDEEVYKPILNNIFGNTNIDKVPSKIAKAVAKKIKETIK